MNTFSTPREQNIIIKCSLKSYKFAEKKCWSMFHHFIKNVINLFKITKLPEALPQQFHSIDFFLMWITGSSCGTTSMWQRGHLHIQGLRAESPERKKEKIMTSLKATSLVRWRTHFAQTKNCIFPKFGCHFNYSKITLESPSLIILESPPKMFLPISKSIWKSAKVPYVIINEYINKRNSQ